MLRLMQWLDLQNLFGRKLRALPLLAAAFLVSGLVLQADFQSSSEPRMVDMGPPVESLFTIDSAALAPEAFSEARHCLAQAIYFEARSEPVKGWEAVADVVINRTHNAKYPSTICGVVFQGEYQRHSCQFSFACDGLSDRARNRRLWKQALDVSHRKLIENRERSETAYATHYHADYVTPYWSEKMVRLTKIGRHIFYLDERVVKF
ncbi:cell wall hydrolase [Alphaproteobacteria bacterium]|nr:cell wall hydrolase [Alphaproteobacteria bacterium]MDC0131534.1 cell wall hydrolase [Alphaproteobacteria bacterium]